VRRTSGRRQHRKQQPGQHVRGVGATAGVAGEQQDTTGDHDEPPASIVPGSNLPITFDAPRAASVVAAASGRNSGWPAPDRHRRRGLQVQRVEEDGVDDNSGDPAIFADASDGIRQVSRQRVRVPPLEATERDEQRRRAGERELGTVAHLPAEGALDRVYEQQQPGHQRDRAGQVKGDATRPGCACRLELCAAPMITVTSIATLMNKSARQPRALVSEPLNSTPAELGYVR
jgi:hypothetical protein